jgi:hypothetical protein
LKILTTQSIASSDLNCNNISNREHRDPQISRVSDPTKRKISYLKWEEKGDGDCLPWARIILGVLKKCSGEWRHSSFARQSPLVSDLMNTFEVKGRI